MPVPRAPEHTRIEDALQALTRALVGVKVPWMVIGGIAVISHGVQRMTTDIDAVIQGGSISTSALIARLRKQKIIPRIDDAEAFAATNLVLLTRHQPTEVELDLSFGWTAFEHEALAACAKTRYGDVAAPMARVEDLLVFKAMAGRPRDIDDAVTLLTLYPQVDLVRVRSRLGELAALADAPELAMGLDAIVQAAKRTPGRAPLNPRKASRPSRTPPKARKR